MFVGIDIGTSGVKTILIDEAQQLIASAQAPLSVSRPHAGWSEQLPEDWIKATELTLEQIKNSHPKALSAVTGIALSGQMHGATLLDKNDKILRPCMLWNDTRSEIQAKQMDDNPEFRTIIGNIVFPGFTAPKIDWVRQNEPKIFSHIKKVLLPKDYVRLWLTGEYVSDMSDASGTAWLNVKQREWSAKLLSICELDLEQMPMLVEGTQASGELKQALAKRWGIQGKPIVAGGAGDNAASACGMGIIKSGSSFVSLGTSGVLFTATDAYQENPENAVHTFCHALADTWHQMGVILSATDSLNWYAGIAGHTASSLTQELGEQLKPSSKLIFLPYLAGERTPHNDSKIRGAFVGLSHKSSRETLTRAVLEGVSFAIRDNKNSIESCGTKLERLVAVGGGSRSHYWLQLLSTVLNLPIDVPIDGDLGGAFGAARLAQIAATSASAESILIPPLIERTIEPNLQYLDDYDNAYSHYLKLYPALSHLSS